MAMRPALAALLLLGAPARGDDLAARAARACPLAPRAPQLAPGEGGAVVVAIRCEPGVHVQRQAPLRATAAASGGLALPRARLGWEDVRTTPGALELTVAVTAVGPGASAVRVGLEYFACSDAWCVRQERELVVPVVIRGPARGASDAPGAPAPSGSAAARPAAG